MLVKSAPNLFYGLIECICAENISPSPLSKVSWGFWGKPSWLIPIIRNYLLNAFILLWLVFISLSVAFLLFDSHPASKPNNPSSMLHGNPPVSVHQFSSNQLPIDSPPTLEDLWHLPGRLRESLFRGNVAPLTSVNSHSVCDLKWPAGINPSLWDKEDVALWLHWAQKEYSLRRPEKGRFEMNGRALCLLTKEDFRHRCPSSGKCMSTFTGRQLL